jgi:hypothetical protein
MKNPIKIILRDNLFNKVVEVPIKKFSKATDSEVYKLFRFGLLTPLQSPLYGLRNRIQNSLEEVSYDQ